MLSSECHKFSYELLLGIGKYCMTLLLSLCFSTELKEFRLKMQTWYNAEWYDSQLTNWLLTPEAYSESIRTSKMVLFEMFDWVRSEYASGLTVCNLLTGWTATHNSQIAGLIQMASGRCFVVTLATFNRQSITISYNSELNDLMSITIFPGSQASME